MNAPVDAHVVTADEDRALLDSFVREGSHAAFRRLVERYAGLVSASARRQVRGDTHLADDVTQAVFIVLARRAGSIADARALPAWLVRTTHFAARDALKMQSRRRKHERKAAEMMPPSSQILTGESHDAAAAATTANDLEPIIDAALARLKAIDRNIVTRRFLQQQSIVDVAGALKMSEAAVRKRLTRAMPKLRAFLSARGVTLSLGVLATLLDQLRPAPADAVLVDRAASAALSPQPGAIATQLAQRILRRIFLIRLGSIAVAIFVLLVVLIAGVSWAMQPRSGDRLAATTAPASQRIKVGILASDYSAHWPDEGGIRQGYQPMANIWACLQDPQIERFAIVEPDTAAKPDLAGHIQRFFGADHVIDGSDPAAVAKLDVMVLPITINMRDNVLAALIAAARDDGVGVMNQCTTGCNHPGHVEAVNQINGMTRSGCFYNDMAVYECPIVSPEHPLMTPFRSRSTLALRNLSGSVGVLREGQALIAAPDGLHNHHTITPAPPAEAHYYPLYVATLGKARIVSINWAEDQQAALDADFYARCSRWLALAHRDAALAQAANHMIGAQLYTLREFTKTPADIAKTLSRVKKMGYDAVQCSALGPIDPAELAKILKNEGLSCVATHVSIDRLEKEPQKVIDEHKLWGCKYTAIGGFFPKEATTQTWLDFATKYNTIAKNFAGSSLAVGYHNHSHELGHYDGKPALKILIEHLTPDIWFEIDTYWITHGGGDPAAWISSLKGRVHCVHLKDMLIKLDRTQYMAEVGEGNLNWPAILAACKSAGVEHLLVEQDICYRDPFDSLELSLKNLKSMGAA